MKCTVKDCPRDVYYDPTGLCLAHEKKRRAKEAAKQAPAKKAPAKKAASGSRGRGRAATTKTTQAVTQTTDATTTTRKDQDS